MKCIPILLTIIYASLVSPAQSWQTAGQAAKILPAMALVVDASKSLRDNLGETSNLPLHSFLRQIDEGHKLRSIQEKETNKSSRFNASSSSFLRSLRSKYEQPHATRKTTSSRKLQIHTLCAPDGDLNWKTITVWSYINSVRLVWFQNHKRGVCGPQCEQICGHKPCFEDYEVSQDSQQCFCSTPSSSKCGTNTDCDNEDCVCKQGFLGDPRSSCTDIDECETVSCAVNAACFNNAGGFDCICNAGYSGDPYSSGCTDINECADPVSACGSNANCNESDGGYSCACQSGYSSNSGNPKVNKDCEDNNECAENAGICGDNASCDNIGGDYTCTCDSGYESATNPKDDQNCEDIDECTETPGICGDNASCDNTPVGDYSCTCDSGYESATNPKDDQNCEDIDECTETPGICGDNASCDSIGGDYTCTCDSGYESATNPKDDQNCQDIDECTETPGICGDNASCDNIGGDYTCTCDSGYESATNPKDDQNCEDINECSDSNPCGSNAICINSIGGSSCACDVGFEGITDPLDTSDCTDILECDQADICFTNGTALQNAICKELEGSYFCQCSDGYWVVGNGTANTPCVDFDECSSSAYNNCPDGTTCVNQEGSYYCESSGGRTMPMAPYRVGPDHRNRE